MVSMEAILPILDYLILDYAVCCYAVCILDYAVTFAVCCYHIVVCCYHSVKFFRASCFDSVLHS